MNHKRKPWTPDQVARLESLLKQTDPSLTYAQIGERMGRSYDSVREAARAHHLLKSPRVRPGRHKWSRAELERLEGLLDQGARYHQIARIMGLTYRQVRGAVERIGLCDPARQGSLRIVKPGAMPIIIDCIELERMTVPMIKRRLRQHGIEVSKDWIHDRVREQGQGLAKELRANAANRRARALQRLARRRKAAKRQQEAA